MHVAYALSSIAQERGTAHECQFQVAWDDGDKPTWLEASDVSLAYRQPLPSELRPGLRVLALYSGVCSVNAQEGDGDEDETDLWFPATVVGPSAPDTAAASAADSVATSFELAWEDGEERFVAGYHELRSFLIDTPIKIRAEKAKPKAKRRDRYDDDDDAIAAAIAAAEAEEAADPEGMAADLLRRSGRETHKSDPSDTKLLREAISELVRVWAGKEPSGEWKLERDASDVPGLLVCSNFLNEVEVEALRTVYGAHRAWVHCAPHAAHTLHAAPTTAHDRSRALHAPRPQMPMARLADTMSWRRWCSASILARGRFAQRAWWAARRCGVSARCVRRCCVSLASGCATCVAQRGCGGAARFPTPSNSRGWALRRSSLAITIGATAGRRASRPWHGPSYRRRRTCVEIRGPL